MSQHPSLHQFQNEIFVLPLKTLIFPSFYCILWKITTKYECISKSYKLEGLQILLFNVSLTCKFCNIPWFLDHPWQNSINFHLEQKTVMLSEEDIQHSTAQHGFPLQWKKSTCIPNLIYWYMYMYVEYCIESDPLKNPGTEYIFFKVDYIYLVCKVSWEKILRTDYWNI